VGKSFTVTPAATREVVAAAGAAGRFVMEAMWTRFCPAVVRLRELVADGAIGEVCMVTADLGVRHPVDPVTQSCSPELGDGLLFHLGVYPVSFAQMLLGASGHTESEIMPLADTVAVQDVLGEIADQLGMRVIEGPPELP
jgi:predicted dehydrogenase